MGACRRPGAGGRGSGSGARRWLGIEWAGEPDVVVVLDVKSGAEWIVNGGMMMVEETVVNSIERFAGT